MRRILGWLVGILVGTLTSLSAAAAPVTFVFDLPSWTFSSSDAVFGSDAILSVTLDNGSASSIGQSYLNSEVVSATVTANGGTFNQTWTSATNGSGLGLSYISTDSAGIATLNLLPSSSVSYVVFDASPWTMQWGILDANNGGPTTFVVQDFAQQRLAYIVPASAEAFTGIIVRSRESVQVPEPGTLALLALGLAGLAVARVRKL